MRALAAAVTAPICTAPDPRLSQLLANRITRSRWIEPALVRHTRTSARRPVGVPAERSEHYTQARICCADIRLNIL
jgi:hypothetical protein